MSKTRTVTKLSSVTGAVSFFVVFLAVSFFGGISGGIFAVFLVFLQYRYGTETTVSHVSNTEYRYCIKIGYTAMHCRTPIMIMVIADAKGVDSTR